MAEAIHMTRADKYPYPQDCRADKDSYPHDRNVVNDCRSDVSPVTILMWLTIFVA